MASHPYISGAGNIAQMIGFLRKNFPASVTSETVKKFSLAPNNESYVINALQFIGIIDQDGKRTDKGHDIFLLDDSEFSKSFEDLVRSSYKDLFDLRGNDAWTMSRPQLTAYFRTTDKTSEAIGTRQANVFIMFRGLAGHEQAVEATAPKNPTKPKTGKPRPSTVKKADAVPPKPTEIHTVELSNSDNRRNMALTVRIEINLPAGGSKETRIPILKKLFAPYPRLEFPEKILTRRSAPQPADAKGRDYLVYVWEVKAADNRRTFRPGNSKHYGGKV